MRSERGGCSVGSRPALLGLAALLVLLLGACSSSPKRGFYQDDGPPERPPADLAGTPDAVPRVEPFHPFANRPYSVLGRRYTPITEDRPFRQRGTASWYGRQFHGNRTSIGERYDMYAMTAAHPTLPLPSYVRVTHLKTGRSAVVRVNDRGPFKSDRVIDLSYAAAVKIGIAAAGIGDVEVLRLTHADIRSGRFRTETTPVRDDAAEPPGVAVAPVVAATQQWAVQLGAFSQQIHAMALRDQAAVRLRDRTGDLPEADREPRVSHDGRLYRVLVGQHARRDDAQALAERLGQALAQETSLFALPAGP
jgi:rare lipoprotein A